jgi:hypothetical protein
MKKRDKASKLQLSRETLRTLEEPLLKEAAGGTTTGCGSNNSCGGPPWNPGQTCHEN